MRRLASLALLALVLTAPTAARQSPGTQDIGTTAFESYVESLRQQAGIPAISGALVQDGVVVWERGLGFANVEGKVRATPDTPYPVADLSQPFAAVLLLQCVEQRRLALDAPLQQYGVRTQDQSATLRQLLSHSANAAGGAFKYDPERYAQLTGAMEYLRAAALSQERRPSSARAAGHDRFGAGARHARPGGGSGWLVCTGRP